MTSETNNTLSYLFIYLLHLLHMYYVFLYLLTYLLTYYLLETRCPHSKLKLPALIHGQI